jgi:hypothetical protein
VANGTGRVMSNGSKKSGGARRRIRRLLTAQVPSERRCEEDNEQ